MIKVQILDTSSNCGDNGFERFQIYVSQNPACIYCFLPACLPFSLYMLIQLKFFFLPIHGFTFLCMILHIVGNFSYLVWWGNYSFFAWFYCFVGQPQHRSKDLAIKFFLASPRASQTVEPALVIFCVSYCLPSVFFLNVFLIVCSVWPFCSSCSVGYFPLTSCLDFLVCGCLWSFCICIFFSLGTRFCLIRSLLHFCEPLQKLKCFFF